MVLKLKTPKRATTTLKTTVRKQKVATKVVALKRPSPFTLKVPVNIVRTLMRTGHWSWNVLNAFGTTTTRFVLYAITRSPRREITSKRAFFGVTIVEQLHTKTPRRWKPISIPVLKRARRRGLSYFHSFQITVYLILFVIVFLIKFLKQYLLSGFIARINLLVACFNWSLLSVLLKLVLSPSVRKQYFVAINLLFDWGSVQMTVMS